MKPPVLCFVIALIMFASPLVASEQVLLNDGFEGQSLSRWTSKTPARILINSTAISGKQSLQINAESGGKTIVNRSITLSNGDGVRLVRVSFLVKSEGGKGGDITVSLLKKFRQGKVEWFDRRNFKDPARFGTVPQSSKWQRVSFQGFFEPTVTSLNLYLNVKAGKTPLKVWFDDITVEWLNRGAAFVGVARGNIYSGESAILPLEITAPEQISEGAVKLRNETGKLLDTIPITRVKRLDIKLPTPGFYDVSAEIMYQDGVRFIKSTTAAVVGPEADEELLNSSRFGINYGSDKMLSDAGAGWSRTWFVLSHPRLKKFADAGYQANEYPEQLPWEDEPVTTIMCFNGQPEWLQDRPAGEEYNSHRLYPITNKDDFCKLVRHVMKRRKYRPRYVELSNEPGVNWKGGSIEKLNQYLRMVAESVKAVDSEAIILGPSLCNIGNYRMQTLKSLISMGMFDYVDELSIHPYVMASAPENEFIERVRNLKKRLAEWGHPDVPIHVTEYGWTTPPGDWQSPVDPLTQARYCSRSLILLAAEEIKSIDYFRFGGVNPRVKSAGYSMLHWWDWSPKPVWAAFAGTAKSLLGCEGPGRIIKIRPSTYYALFRRGEKTIVAIWDVKGTVRMKLPMRVFDLHDMTGRPVSVADDGTVDISQSPVFAVVEDPSLYDMTVSKKIVGRRGQEIRMPQSYEWVPTPLKSTRGGIMIPFDTPGGEYFVMRKTGSGWSGQKIQVSKIVDIENVSLEWLADSKSPCLKAELVSYHDKALPVSGTVKLKGLSEPIRVRSSLSPMKASDLCIPLDALEIGRRYQGTLSVIVLESGEYYKLGTEVDITVLPCPRVDKWKSEATRNWKNIVAVDISEWGSFTTRRSEENISIESADCSGKMFTAYSDEGLHLRIEVRDDVHLQEQSPDKLWLGDSIQIAFDADVELPWQGNVGGWNGHTRVYEYGVALGENGDMKWRSMSFDEDLGPDQCEDRITTRITRIDDKTVYELIFPWVTLGMSSSPSPGSQLGVSLLINDIDGGEPRKGLHLFGGIVDEKNPKQFGRLFFRSTLP